MARLPDFTGLGSRDTNSVRGLPNYDRSDPEAAALLKVGEGLSAAGATGMRLLKEDQAEDLRLARVRADGMVAEQVTGLLTDQRNAPDAAGFENRTREIVGAAAAMLPAGKEREAWLAQQQGTLARGRATVQGLVERRDADAGMAGILRDETPALNRIAEAADSDAKNKIMQGVTARYDQAAKAGWITDVQAEKGKNDFARRVAMTELGLTDPEERIAATQGVPTDKVALVDRITGYESGGKADAKNPLSTATGLGQFIEGTWLATVRAHRPDLLEGRSRAQVLALRNDPELSREMTGHLADDNAAALKGAGLAPSAGNVYLSHVLGSGGAAAVLKAAPDTPVEQLLGADAIASNRSILAGKTAGQVAAWASRRMGDVPAAGFARLLTPLERERVAAGAEAEISKRERAAQLAMREEAAGLRTRMNDDLAAVERVGHGDPNLKAEDIERVFGADGRQSWQDARARSYRAHETLDGIEGLPAADIEQRLRKLEPQPGAASYSEDAKMVNGVRRRVDSLLKARESDPAATVDGLPVVRDARASAGYDTAESGARTIKPESAQSIIRARLQAQEQIGIVEPHPVTRAEAQAITRKLRSIGDDNEPALNQ